MTGGALTAGPGWPWIFLVNVPFSLVLIPAFGRLLPTLPGSRGQVDVIGALLVSAFAGSLVYTLMRIGERGSKLDGRFSASGSR